MGLTMHSDAAPLCAPVQVGPGVAAMIGRLARFIPPKSLPGAAELLTARAAFSGWQQRGRISANGSCHLLPTLDGWVAINLAREDDHRAVAALVEAAPHVDPWITLADHAATVTSAALRDRATLLDMPASILCEAATLPAVIARPLGRPNRGYANPSPLIVDLSAMWAGPLCARLLGLAGGKVVKVESPDRLDGMRFGNARFYDWLHYGHDSVLVDMRSPAGLAGLMRLIGRADIVIESSRPRAMAGLGIDPEKFLSGSAGRLWISISGYGRSGPSSNRPAFGDDAAVAGGLVARDNGGEPVFCADAIADPLTGLFAATTTLETRAAGGGVMLELSMAGVAARFARKPPQIVQKAAQPTGNAETWMRDAPFPMTQPAKLIAPSGSAAAPGAHTHLYIP